MQAELDMSNRIEETNRPTVLAIADGVTATLRISGKDKQVIIRSIKRYKPQWEKTFIHVLLFATLVSLLIRRYAKRLDRLFIDPEYLGYEPVIKNWILQVLKRSRITLDAEQIAFQHVGKKSPAHEAALRVIRGKKKPDMKATVAQVMREFGA